VDGARKARALVWLTDQNGSGANFIKGAFLSGGASQISNGRHCSPKFRGGLSGEGFEVELLLPDFRREFDATDGHGRRLESLEPEHRPHPLLYPPVVLLVSSPATIAC
jgi:hypothetical protein